MQKRQIVTNAMMSTLQVIVSGVALFVLYRFFLDTIGEDLFGVWSVVLATTAVGGVAKAGLHGSMTKFVAQYRAREDDQHAARIVETAALTIIVVVGVIAFGLLFALQPLLDFVIEEPPLQEAARSILPYALGSFFLTALSSIYQSSIDGMQRVDLQNLLVLISTLLYMGLCFWLVPTHGLIGLALAQVLQNSFLLLASILVLYRLLGPMPLVPTRWSWTTLKEIFAYSFNFQLLSISQMLFLPTAKMVLAKLAGTGPVAYFEMANKMSYQVRSVISMGHQALVPTIADLKERAPETLRSLYVTSVQAMVFLILLMLPPLILLVPSISYLWIGSLEPTFVLFGMILLTAWFLNLLMNAAYFSNLGTGHLRWNVYGHFAIGGANLVLSIGLGWLFGPLGVVLGFAMSIQVGTLVTVGAYHRAHGITTRSLLRKADRTLLAAVCVGLLLAFGLRAVLPPTLPVVAREFLTLLLYLAVPAFALVQHPMRHTVLGWLGSLTHRNQPEG